MRTCPTGMRHSIVRLIITSSRGTNKGGPHGRQNELLWRHVTVRKRIGEALSVSTRSQCRPSLSRCDRHRDRSSIRHPPRSFHLGPLRGPQAPRWRFGMTARTHLHAWRCSQRSRSSGTLERPVVARVMAFHRSRNSPTASRLVPRGEDASTAGRHHRRVAFDLLSRAMR